MVERVRRHWLATPASPTDLLSAAQNTGTLTCVSAARRRGWWVPSDADPRIHLRLLPGGRPPDHGVTAHWARALGPPLDGLIAGVEDALSDIARCLGHESALVVWESAIRKEALSPEALRRVPWRSSAAQRLAGEVRGLSDSGLETTFAVRLSAWGVPFAQQALVAGRRVDLLIGRRLVVQIDGFSYHSDASQRGRDVSFDAELVLRGYTVLRFTYAQVVYDWPQVERAVARAIAAGLHL
jgi:very-short-patch-repair endonuclease